MKKALKLISTTSILLAGILIILTKFADLGIFSNPDIVNVSVIIYLVSSLYLYRLELKEKGTKIAKLEADIKKLK